MSLVAWWFRTEEFGHDRTFARGFTAEAVAEGFRRLHSFLGSAVLTSISDNSGLMCCPVRRGPGFRCRTPRLPRSANFGDESAVRYNSGFGVERLVYITVTGNGTQLSQVQQ